jgi:hypothetical protein
MFTHLTTYYDIWRSASALYKTQNKRSVNFTLKEFRCGMEVLNYQQSPLRVATFLSLQGKTVYAAILSFRERESFIYTNLKEGLILVIYILYLPPEPFGPLHSPKGSWFSPKPFGRDKGANLEGRPFGPLSHKPFPFSKLAFPTKWRGGEGSGGEGRDGLTNIFIKDIYLIL